MHVCMRACMHACTYACMRICVYVCMQACMYVCMPACMYACMHSSIVRPVALITFSSSRYDYTTIAGGPKICSYVINALYYCMYVGLLVLLTGLAGRCRRPEKETQRKSEV